MAELFEFAQLAGRVYSRTDQNRTPVPDGWSELSWKKDDGVTGFSAGAYRKGAEIVISFAGTNQTMWKDFVVANIPAGGGLSSAQIIQVTTFVLDTMKANPGNSISYIFAGGAYNGTRIKGPEETPYQPPAHAKVVGATWAVYPSEVMLNGEATTTDTIQSNGSDDASDVGDIVDAGTGDDFVDGGYGEDLIDGGDNTRFGMLKRAANQDQWRAAA